MADGLKITVKQSGRVKKIMLDQGPMTAIGEAMVKAQKLRWSKAVISNDQAAKRLSIKYFFEKRKFTGQNRPVRDMRMTGRTVENFQLRKAINNTIRAENSTRLERQKAQTAQKAEDMIGFAPSDQMVVFRESKDKYGDWLQKAWVPLTK